MQKIFRYKKFIGLTVSITIFLLIFPLSPTHAVMIATENVNHQDSEQLSDRERVRAFLARADVMAQMQASGISYEEALSRVDCLTDREITRIAGKMDQVPEVAGGYELDGSLLSIIGLAIYAIFMAIAVYFSRTMEKEFKTKKSTIPEFSWKSSPRLAKLVNAENFEFDISSLDPGRFSFPYHFHRNAEELFVIISGKAMLRTPDGLAEIKKMM